MGHQLSIPVGRIDEQGGAPAWVSLTGFDELALADTLTPSVTVGAQNLAAIGATTE